MIAQRFIMAALLAAVMTVSASAATGKRPAPDGAPPGAPSEYTQFTPSELTRGFLALAFGSDLRVGGKPLRIRKFTAPVQVQMIDEGSKARGDAYRKVLREFAAKVPGIAMDLTDDAAKATMTVRLIDEKHFRRAMEHAFGKKIAREFVQRTDPQCMTSVKSNPDGTILHSDVFIITDQGDDVFYDCAYHETLHAFGLSNHANAIPWTTLNQNRAVGYLTVYDRAQITMLYDSRIHPGMSPADVRKALPSIIADLTFAR